MCRIFPYFAVYLLIFHYLLQIPCISVKQREKSGTTLLTYIIPVFRGYVNNTLENTIIPYICTISAAFGVYLQKYAGLCQYMGKYGVISPINVGLCCISGIFP